MLTAVQQITELMLCLWYLFFFFLKKKTNKTKQNLKKKKKRRGYTEAEKELHFADMERLTSDMFNGDTFSSYLPLFNIVITFSFLFLFFVKKTKNKQVGSFPCKC